MRVYTPQLEEHGWYVDAHRRRDRQRRHALPRRLGEHGAEPPRERRPPDHPPGRPRPARRRRPLLEVLPHDAERRDCWLESFIHAEIDARDRPGAPGGLRASLERVLGDVRAAVEDWPAMRERGREIVAELDASPPPLDAEELAETNALLELDRSTTTSPSSATASTTSCGEDGERRAPARPGDRARDPARTPALEPRHRQAPGRRSGELAREQDPLVLTKANSRATVHRPSYLDYVGVKRFDEAGEVDRRAALPRPVHVAPRTARSPRRDPAPAAQGRGSASSAPASRPGATPTRPSSRSSRPTRATSSSRSPTTTSSRSPMGILHLGERQRVRLFVRRDRFGRFLSCLVFVPARPLQHAGPAGDRSEILREAFHGDSVDCERPPVGVGAGPPPLRRPHRARRRCRTSTSASSRSASSRPRAPGSDDLRDALVDAAGRGAGHRAVRALRRRVPGRLPRRLHAARGRRSTSSGSSALDPAGDLAADASTARSRRRGRLLRPQAATARASRSSLSDVLPLLENLGVKRRTTSGPYEIDRDGPVDRVDLRLRPDVRATGPIDPAAVRRGVPGGVRAGVARRGRERRLQPSRPRAPGSTWREVAVLRAYCQVPAPDRRAPSARPTWRRRSPPTRRSSRSSSSFPTPASTRRARRRRASRGRRARRRRSRQALDAVAEPRRGPHPAQLPPADPGDAADELLPARRRRRARSRTSRSSSTRRSSPTCRCRGRMFEIFVYSPRIEGVHLRGGKVARGGHPLVGPPRGLPHRDPRPDEGADGEERRHRPGRAPRAASSSSSRPAATARRSRDEVRRLLPDVHPRAARRHRQPRRRRGRAAARRRRYDDDDPYLVVAADKGTATFSDIANGIARRVRLLARRRVRLGRLGRLRPQGDGHHRARRLGVGEAPLPRARRRHPDDRLHGRRHRRHVRRRLRQRHAPLPHIALVAAFDHRHVFLDPDPDPERELRASASGCSSCRARRWADYDRALISPGGGVFPRTAKSIPLSPRGAPRARRSRPRRSRRTS